MAQRLVASVESERTTNRFQELWQEILIISTDLDMEPSWKRIVKRQQTRTNPSVTDLEGIGYFFAFLDHTLQISSWVGRGSSSNLFAAEGHKRYFRQNYSWHQSRICCSPSLSIKLWKWGSSLETTLDLLATCNFADDNEVYYPNIYAILLLLLSLPVGLCSCERSFSALRRLKMWCWSSMTDELLDQLALVTSIKTGYFPQKMFYEPGINPGTGILPSPFGKMIARKMDVCACAN